MGHLLFAVDGTNLIQVLDGRTQTAVHAEYLSVYDSRQAQVVKDLGAVAPHSHRAVFAQAFVIESVDLCDLPGLVVASYQSDAVRVTDLKLFRIRLENK